MTDVSKTVYVGEWELYPCEGKVYIQSTTHPKIVLTDAEAMHVWHLLNVWVERNARRVEGDLLKDPAHRLARYNTNHEVWDVL